jgi:hypothetical protein
MSLGILVNQDCALTFEMVVLLVLGAFAASIHFDGCIVGFPDAALNPKFPKSLVSVDAVALVGICLTRVATASGASSLSNICLAEFARDPRGEPRKYRRTPKVPARSAR